MHILCDFDVVCFIKDAKADRPQDEYYFLPLQFKKKEKYLKMKKENVRELKEIMKKIPEAIMTKLTSIRCQKGMEKTR